MKTLGLILLIVLIYSTQQQLQDDCVVADSEKLDCGFSGINKEACEAKKCCWSPVSVYEQAEQRLLNKVLTSSLMENGSKQSQANVPWCFYQKNFNPCPNLTWNAPDPGFDQTWYDGMYKKFLDNIDIDGMGGIVAAPDNSTPGGSYWFHWMRDASLTMRSLIEMNDNNTSSIDEKMKDWVNWVVIAQDEPDPNNIDVIIEPKFTLNDRKPFTGGWCRPQTDGPALEATALIMYANTLLEGGQSDYVYKYLWTKDGSFHGGAIKYDLDWVVENWKSSIGCDLWEEIRSDDFFWNRMSFKHSLEVASQFATKIGQTDLASKYASTAKEIADLLDGHWTGTFMTESSNRQRDAAVIHAFSSFPGQYDFTDPKIAKTIKNYNILFCLQNPINVIDNAAGIPGILYGRYEGDSYAGGNPWQLLSAILAKLFYQGAQVTLDKYDSNQILSEEYVSEWRGIYNLSENPSAMEFVEAALAAGDSVMTRIYAHVRGDSYDITEQIDKNNGKQISAKKLTWSYANILQTLHFRSKLVQNKLKKLQ